MVGPTIFGVDYPLPPGSMTVLSYGQRLYEFPLGVFGVAIATAIFPALSRESNDPDRFMATLRRGMRLSFFIGFPASVGLVLVREPLAAAIFQGGQFSHEDVQKVGFVLAMYAPAIWAYSMQQLSTRAFYALGDSVTPVKVSIWMVAQLCLEHDPDLDSAWRWRACAQYGDCRHRADHHHDADHAQAHGHHHGSRNTRFIRTHRGGQRSHGGRRRTCISCV
jgi:hypothetical protein